MVHFNVINTFFCIADLVNSSGLGRVIHHIHSIFNEVEIRKDATPNWLNHTQIIKVIFTLSTIAAHFIYCTEAEAERAGVGLLPNSDTYSMDEIKNTISQTIQFHPSILYRLCTFRSTNISLSIFFFACCNDLMMCHALKLHSTLSILIHL